MLMLLLFLHSILFEIVKNLSLCDNCHFVTIAYCWLICKQSIGTSLRYFYAHSSARSDSSTVESSPRNPWIGFSKSDGNYFPFQYHVQWILFPPKNVHLVSLSISTEEQNPTAIFNVPSPSGKIILLFFQSGKSKGIREKCLKSGKSKGILIDLYIMRVHKNSC